MEKVKILFTQLFRFGIVGGIAFTIDYTVLIFLTEFVLLHVLISNAIAFSVAVVFNYILSIKWVFNVNGKRNQKTDLIVFVGLSIVGLLINQFIMWFLISRLHIHYMIAKLFATAVVLIFNFVTRKFFLESSFFKQSNEK